MDTEKLQSWLSNLISGLVTYPEEIKIEKSIDEIGVLFTIKVHNEDKGKVIGKEGTIANAIRIVLRSSGRIMNLRASMKIDADGFQLKNRD